MNASNYYRIACHGDEHAVVASYPHEHADRQLAWAKHSRMGVALRRSLAGGAWQKIYHGGTEDTEFIGHRDSQTDAPEVRRIRLLAVDIWSSLNKLCHAIGRSACIGKSLAFLPNTDRSIKSEIGAPSISGLMEPPFSFFSSVPLCLRGEILRSARRF